MTDIKPVVSHKETVKKGEEQVYLKSGEDQLTPWQTAVRFKKVSHTECFGSPQAVTICTMLCVAAAADGYQINLNGE